MALAINPEDGYKAPGKELDLVPETGDNFLKNRVNYRNRFILQLSNQVKRGSIGIEVVTIQLISILLLSSIILIVIIFLMRNLHWIISQIRSICENEVGYIKLIQLVFVLLVFSSFLLLLIYNLIYKENTSKSDIFLTVVVGLIGTIVGTFFSERAMESIKKDRDRKRKVILQKTTQLEAYKDILETLKKRLR